LRREPLLTGAILVNLVCFAIGSTSTKYRPGTTLQRTGLCGGPAAATNGAALRIDGGVIRSVS